MIKQISIHNFQSHKNTLLELSEKVNVLIGSSDSGKTAILRALSWIIFNRPAGEAFRSDWGGDTFVRVELEEEVAASRTKGKNANTYSLDLPDPQGSLEFKAMGQSVPDEVAVALNLADINIQYQMDSPFLLSSDWSPGRVAEYLNEAAGLDVIDRATANINAKIRKTVEQLNAREALVDELREKHDALNYVDDIETRVKQLEAAAQAASKLRADEQALNNTVADVKRLTAEIAALPDYGATRKKIDALIAAEQEAVRVEARQDELERIITDIKSLQHALARVRKTTRAARLVDHTMKQAVEYKELDARRITIEELLAGIYDIEELIEQKGINIAAMQKQLPDVCPLCSGTGRLK